jgi:two-component system, response regulator, stage 0 sporulation protein F
LSQDPLLVIADDDADMRALVRATLAGAYPDVLEVGDGRDLMWQLLRSSFGSRDQTLREIVIVTDVRMPSYSGLDVLDAWQEGEGDAPIVIITSFPDDHVRARVTRLGATLLPKPFSRAGLRAAVDHAARNARRARERMQMS